MERLWGAAKRFGLRRLTASLLVAAGVLWLLYQSDLIAFWIRSEEYGHGPLVLLVLGYLVYRWRGQLPVHEPGRLWTVVPVAAVPLLVFAIGALAGINQLLMYGAWLFAVAGVFAFGGWALVRALLVPLLIAFMVIPLPNGVEVALTAKLQLLSSQLGVWFIRLFGGVVHLQGNVIDMGTTQLLVAEACAGLRYLYPLMSLGAIGGYLFRGPLWARWTLFLATIPITILLNSFRIGVTGILVAHWGTAHTEGFLHFFEGWVVFVTALLILLMIAALLLKLQRSEYRLMDALSLAAPRNERQASAEPMQAAASGGRSLFAVAALIVVAALLAPMLNGRPEQLPERHPLAEFPLQIGEWSAREYRLPPIVEAVAGASDYFYADYSAPGLSGLNLYVSYYHTQRHGKIPHSPRVCIPGDGWEIVSHRPVNIRDASGNVFEANRLITSKGDRRVLAYYWLKQGPRTYRQEMLARLDLIRTSALERRTDGALIRLVAELAPDDDIAEVERRLGDFAASITAVLPAYVPD